MANNSSNNSLTESARAMADFVGVGGLLRVPDSVVEPPPDGSAGPPEPERRSRGPPAADAVATAAAGAAAGPSKRSRQAYAGEQTDRICDARHDRIVLLRKNIAH